MLNIKVKDMIIKGLDLSNIVCEYEVNLSTNEQVIKNNVEYQGQGHDNKRY